MTIQNLFQSTPPDSEDLKNTLKTFMVEAFHKMKRLDLCQICYHAKIVKFDSGVVYFEVGPFHTYFKHIDGEWQYYDLVGDEKYYKCPPTMKVENLFNRLYWIEPFFHHH